MTPPQENSIEYAGDELESFLSTTTWREYVVDHIKPFIRGDLAEVGAGLGYFSKVFSEDPFVKSLTLFEPDQKNYSTLSTQSWVDGDRVKIFKNSFIESEKKYDTIFLMDVLEHIENDKETLQLLGQSLKPDGHIVLLIPAHMFLYSHFDEKIGHYRRYNKEMIKKACPEGLAIEKSLYLDSVGIAASFMAKLFKMQPGPFSLKVWDRVFVKVSRVVDPLFGHKVGKSLVVILKRKD